MKRVVALTFLNYFVYGGLTLTIPLLLLDRRVNLAEIGMVLSTMPLVFLSVRLLISALADQVGWAPFFLFLNWPGTFLSTTIYYLANSSFAFFMGKIVEGVKESAYWAVSRTAVFALSPRREEKEAIRLNAVTWLSIAVGSAVAGTGIAYVGFSSTLGLMIAASTMIGIPAALLWQGERGVAQLRISRALALLDPRGRKRTFWLVSLAMLFYSLAIYSLITLLLPVFMAQQIGYDYVSIGVAYMGYNVVVSFVTLSTLKVRLGIRRVVIQSLIGLVATFFLANSGAFFPVFFLTLAVMHGLGIGFYESIIAKVTKKRFTVSVDIGLLLIPTRLAEFASVLSAGFVAQSVGYLPMFAASGIFFMIFSVLSLYALKLP